MSKRIYSFLLVLFTFLFIFLSSSCDKTNNSEKNHESYKLFETEKFSMLLPKKLITTQDIKKNSFGGNSYSWGGVKTKLYIQVDTFQGKASLTTTEWVNRFKTNMQKRKNKFLYDKKINSNPVSYKLAANKNNITSYIIMTKKNTTFFMFQFIIRDKDYPQYKDIINYLQDNIKIK